MRLQTSNIDEYVNGTHVTPSGNISKFSLDFLGQGEKTGKDGKAGGLQHTDGVYISINPIGNAKFHKTYGSKEVVRRDEADEMGRGGWKVYTYYLQIPDLSRENYIFEYETIKKYPHVLRSVNEKLSEQFGNGSGMFLDSDGTIRYSIGNNENTIKNEPFINANTLTCANYYRLLKEIFFDKNGKDTSEFLSECGVIGLIYHGHQDALCAVIYDTSAIKIVDKKTYNIKKGMSGDDIKKDYIGTTDYTERLNRYNAEHPEEYSEREKFKGHIATKPKNHIAGKKYDSELNFQYPLDGAFKNDKSHNITEVRNTIIHESVNKQVITLTESDLRIMIKECVRMVVEENLRNNNYLPFSL